MTQTEGILELITQTQQSTAKEKEVSAQDLETIYISAFQLYQIGNYSKALDLFMQLTLACPFEAPFWKGLASCYQMQGLWDLALNAWSHSALLDSNDPTAHYHAAECMHAQKNFEEATKALHLAKKLCTEDKLLTKINALFEFCKT
ncbi:MAG: hypothetical protein EBZ47_06330 [Chlamydiae bacterium]|nr:hypothetical protein [Chlamydiota bacterium]